MSIKKTWFSYILWLFATGFSILFTYSYILGIVICYSFDVPNRVYSCIGISAGFVAGVSLVYALIWFVRSKLAGITIPKWGKRLLHILLLCGMTAVFITSRCMVLFSVALEDVVPIHIFETAKVMQAGGQSATYEVLLMFEEIYINVLSVLFLFLGNKMEIMLYFQIFLQAVSLLLLLFIGRTLQKGFWGWIPALVYTLSQFCMDAVLCMDSDNFWFCVVLLGIAFICILEKAWKNKRITYIMITVAGIVFSMLSAIDAYPHLVNFTDAFKFWLHEKLVMGGAGGFWSFLVLVAFMGFYCISFWKTRIDNASAYILPVAGFAVIIYFDLDAGIITAVFMLIRIYMSFMVAEGLRILFEVKQKVMMEQKEEPVSEDIQTEEAAIEDVLMEDTGVIRVSDILKAVNVEETDEGETAGEQTTVQEETVDKTAMIENVLPMPKKHVARTFEYAFEPEEGMMHYDVEIENDDYDYE